MAKEENKGKGKKVLRFILIITLLSALGVGAYFLLNYIYKKNTSYDFIRLTKEASIYKKENNNYIEIGKVDKNSIFKLDKNNLLQEYFKLKDENIYLKNKDIQKEIYNDTNKLIAFNKNIINNDKTIIKRDDKKINLNIGLSFPILEEKENTYTIKFNGLPYEIDKTSVKSIEDKENTKDLCTEIPVVYLKDIDKYEDILKEVKKLGFNEISYDTYKKWKNNNIALNGKNVLLLGNKNLYKVKDIKEVDMKIKYIYELSKARKNSVIPVNIYNKDNFIDILNGKYIPEKASGVPVLNYHFFYDKNKRCREILCKRKDRFQEEMKFLFDNGYKTLTMEEYRLWLKGEIDVPKKSVLITVDDGGYGTSMRPDDEAVLQDVLREYDNNAVIFLITQYYAPRDYGTENLEVASHGKKIHIQETASCPYPALCLTKEGLNDDIKQSLDAVPYKKGFAYPFYVYNQTFIDVLKENNVEFAFIGGERYSRRTDDPYKLPRYVIYDNYPGFNRIFS